MTEPQKFAAKLHAALVERGWSQSELARRAGLRRDVISTCCRAASLPSRSSLLKIAKALGGSPAELLDGSLPSLELPTASPDPKPKLAPRPPGGGEIHAEDGGIRLRIDQRVSVEQAMSILSILSLKPDA